LPLLTFPFYFFRYTMFWVALLLTKFAFSYYAEVVPYKLLFCHAWLVQIIIYWVTPLALTCAIELI
jgi:hypothetical protein